MFCRTKEGTLRLVHEGEEIILDIEGRDLPAALAESIRTHVNVVVGEKAHPPPHDSAKTAEPKKKERGGYGE
jgi:hypothetical protein